MRRAAVIVVLGCLLPSAGLRAEPRVSVATQAHVTAALPAFDPKAHEQAEAEKAAEVATDPDIVVMPEMTVQEKALKRMNEDSLYRKGQYDKELVKRELSEFDRYFLNRFTIPLFGISKETRARELYLQRKQEEFQQRVKEAARLNDALDPDAAKQQRRVLVDTSRTGQLPASNARSGNGW